MKDIMKTIPSANLAVKTKNAEAAAAGAATRLQAARQASPGLNKYGGVLVPTVAPVTEGFNLLLATPGEHIEIPNYNPIYDALNSPIPDEFLVGTATESSGNASATVAAAAGYAALAHVFLVKIFPDPDQAGITNALMSVTFNDYGTNAMDVGNTEAAGVTTGGDVTNTGFTFRFGIPSAQGEQRAYVHLAKRPTGLGKVVPAKALIRTAGTADAAIPVWNAVFAATGMPSGCGAQLVVSAIHPGTPEWKDYVSFMAAFLNQE